MPGGRSPKNPERGVDAARRLQYASRRPLTAFMVFAGEMRGKILQQRPQGTDAELGRQLVKLWQALTDDEKQARCRCADPSSPALLPL